MFKKFENGFREQDVFNKRIFLKNFDFITRCENKIRDYNVNMKSIHFYIFLQIDSTTNGHHRDNPPAWELNQGWKSNKVFHFNMIIIL